MAPDRALRPLAVDLYAGIGGWAEGLLAEGYAVVGFDVERHQYGTHRYPAQLVLQDVLTLHGAQFRDAALIVASPPCQAYSWMAMPWSRAKAKAAAIRADDTGQALADLNRLFDACFRIQAQASLAAGRHIPMIVENVRGAQPWVGRARWNFGSFYLWGDVPALMPFTAHAKQRLGTWSNYGKPDYVPFGFNRSAEAALKVPGFRFDGSGRSFQTASVEGMKGVPHRTTGHWTNPNEHEGVKQRGSGDAWWDKALDERRKEATAIKNGGDWFSGNSFEAREAAGDIARGMRGILSAEDTLRHRSSARKAASALIAKIPLPLSRHIAATFRG